ncbi:glycosyltransferase family 39 protein [Phormidium sp. CLA17]|uniref:glycosyltransferase family 39 protein n=1 Tax=Leptolyngbya sp. Cla-17 TaxID=2803751 RepID=UPI0014915E8C|nr:glycosyltransferase family 39 protein [Leptolyngbya sp. Cla-17]MBM0740281.1 glycosyltransferase family 39 protein [Leptolyngbya sp. Cla-17]
MKSSRHYWLLAGILLLGAVLRFWHLDLKPLWMDEVITALFSLGHTYYDVPLEKALPLSAFEQVFTLNAQATCAQITKTVSVQSVHPPLFFCGMHQWLNWLNPLPVSWVWKLRSLPALCGVGAIAALYLLNRIAFSPKAGLVGAALMAVSPFAVYLSQEARHYTFPMLLIILALAGLYAMLVDLQKQRFRLPIWLGWIAVNSIGFYVHYFFLLAFLAQSVTLVLGASKIAQSKHATTWQQAKNALSFTAGDRNQKTAQPRVGEAEAEEDKPLYSMNSTSYTLFTSNIPSLISIFIVCLAYLPWLPTFFSHTGRPEIDWMKSHAPSWQHVIAPLYQLPMGWILMVAAFPVEQQPIWVVVLGGVPLLIFIVWLIWQVKSGLRQLWRSPQSHLGTWMLVTFILVVVLEFVAIAYLVGTDLTQVPRYNFIYFPAVCALIGACLSQRSPNRNESNKLIFRLSKTPSAIAIVLLVALLSSLFVVQDLVFQKPYNPGLVAQNLSVEPIENRLVVNAYQGFQDIALGLSFALKLQQQEHQVKKSSRTHFALLSQTNGYNQVWADLAQLKQPLSFPLNLWVISPGLRRRDYNQQLMLGDRAGAQHSCDIDPTHHYRLGVPYQLYQCTK